MKAKKSFRQTNDDVFVRSSLLDKKVLASDRCPKNREFLKKRSTKIN